MTEQVENKEVASQLPDPVGYKMLLMLPETSETYESGILKSDQTRRNDEVASVVAFVAKMGPDCYNVCYWTLVQSGRFCNHTAI
jgi:hypothetical protein